MTNRKMVGALVMGGAAVAVGLTVTYGGLLGDEANGQHVTARSCASEAGGTRLARPPPWRRTCHT